MARSTLANIQALKVVQGGSTIQMQLIRNLFWLNERRTLGKKLLEMAYAVRLTLHMPRSEILEKYIDSVSFGHMTYGLASAAEFYFKKTPANLTTAEQIALLSIPRDATRYDPYNHPAEFKARFNLVVATLFRAGLLTTKERNTVLSERLAFLPGQDRAAPYAMDYVNKKMVADGYQQTVQTTFDLDLSSQVESIAQGALLGLSWKDVGDYSIIIADRQTRQLKVLIGGQSWSSSSAGQVNSALALRLPGSSVKPFTYALAFQNLGLTPNSRLLDVPTQFLTKEGYSYAPKNYSMSFA